MRELRIIVAAIVLIASCALVSAQSSSPAKSTPTESATGTISGNVVNELGQGIAGAYVVVRTGSGNYSRSTTTDSDGNFRVNGLDSSLYYINATAPAYLADPDARADTYRIGDSAQLRLLRGGVITGTVTNAAGDPVIEVRVRATRIRDSRGEALKRAGVGFTEQPTDDRGIYRIYGVPPGTYVVSAGGTGNYVSLNAFDTDVPTYSPSSSRETATEILVKGGEESVADIRYRGEQGYSISGIVKVSGNNRATVSLTHVATGTPVVSTWQPDGSSGFAFNGLEAGDYKLVAQEYSPVPSVPPIYLMSDVKRVTIKSASVSGVELVTKPLASISGRVLLEPAKLSECESGRPPQFAETSIDLRRHEKDIEEDDPIYPRVNSTSVAPANGAFTLLNLSPGRYRLEPRYHARNWYLQSITLSTGGVKPQKIDAAANWTVLKSGEQLTSVTITLAEGAASVRGRLAVAESTSISSYPMIYLVPSEPDQVNNVLRFFATETAADGSFVLNGLAPGKYLILATGNLGEPVLPKTANLRHPDAAAIRTKLRSAAEVKKTEIELKLCQNLAYYQLKP